jgi:hypothetical protein
MYPKGDRRLEDVKKKNTTLNPKTFKMSSFLKFLIYNFTFWHNFTRKKKGYPRATVGLRG